MWFLLLFLVILMMILGVSTYTVYLALYPKTWDYESTYRHEIEKGRFTREWYDALPKEEFSAASSFGYGLHGIWMPVEGSKKSVVLVHGYGFSLFGSIKYVRIFRDLGFNVLVYDHRYHGLSGGLNSTFGAYEKDDLKTMIKWVRERVGEDSLIGTHGESLGGATVLMEGAEESDAAFIISDCAFARMDIELAYRLKVQYRLPPFPIIYIGSVISRLITGYFFDQVSPMASATALKVPTMLIHGTGDDYTPFAHGEMIYSNLDCPKKFYKAQKAGHANALINDPEEYERQIRDFLESNHII